MDGPLRQASLLLLAWLCALATIAFGVALSLGLGYLRRALGLSFLGLCLLVLAADVVITFTGRKLRK